MRKALLVGVDDYPGTSNDLNSCLNDIASWRSLLMERFDFERETIRLLANSRATRDATIERLNWLTTGAKKGDSLVFVYSGHGTTFTERNDLGRPDEAKDQALCLYGEEWTGSLLVDDDLNEIVSKIPPGINLTIICDSCFSGGMDKSSFRRTAGVGKSRQKNYANKIRSDFDPRPGPFYPDDPVCEWKFLRPPIDIEHRNDPLSPTRPFGCCLPKVRGLKAAKSADTSGTKSLVLAACRDIETAGAGREETAGLSVFSCYAIREIKVANRSLTPRQLIQRTAQAIANASHPQIPQMKGNEDLFDKPIFG